MFVDVFANSQTEKYYTCNNYMYINTSYMCAYVCVHMYMKCFPWPFVYSRHVYVTHLQMLADTLGEKSVTTFDTDFHYFVFLSFADNRL